MNGTVHCLALWHNAGRLVRRSVQTFVKDCDTLLVCQRGQSCAFYSVPTMPWSLTSDLSNRSPHYNNTSPDGPGGPRLLSLSYGSHDTKCARRQLCIPPEHFSYRQGKLPSTRMMPPPYAHNAAMTSTHNTPLFPGSLSLTLTVSPPSLSLLLSLLQCSAA